MLEEEEKGFRYEFLSEEKDDKDYKHAKQNTSASVLRNSLYETPHERCDRLKLSKQQEQSGNDTSRFNNEIIAVFDKQLQYKCTTKTQQKLF